LNEIILVSPFIAIDAGIRGTRARRLRFIALTCCRGLELLRFESI
jgi:hypothetical protein